MIQLKEKEVNKFLEHDKEKYLNQIESMCASMSYDNLKNSEIFKNLIHDIFSAGFNSGVKTAAILLKGACKSLNPEEKIES